MRYYFDRALTGRRRLTDTTGKHFDHVADAREFADHIAAELGAVLDTDASERGSRAIAVINEEGTEVYRAPLKRGRGGRH